MNHTTSLILTECGCPQGRWNARNNRNGISTYHDNPILAGFKALSRQFPEHVDDAIRFFTTAALDALADIEINVDTGEVRVADANVEAERLAVAASRASNDPDYRRSWIEEPEDVEDEIARLERS